MNKCPKCSANLPDEANFCFSCMSYVRQRRVIGKPEVSKNSFPKLMALAAAAVFAAGGTAAYFALKDGNAVVKGTSSSEAAASISQTDELQSSDASTEDKTSTTTAAASETTTAADTTTRRKKNSTTFAITTTTAATTTLPPQTPAPEYIYIVTEVSTTEPPQTTTEEVTTTTAAPEKEKEPEGSKEEKEEKTTTAAFALEGEESKLKIIINNERSKAGLTSLKTDKGLCKAAAERCRQIKERFSVFKLPSSYINSNFTGGHPWYSMIYSYDLRADDGGLVDSGLCYEIIAKGYETADDLIYGPEGLLASMSGSIDGTEASSSGKAIDYAGLYNGRDNDYRIKKKAEIDKDHLEDHRPVLKQQLIGIARKDDYWVIITISQE